MIHSTFAPFHLDDSIAWNLKKRLIPSLRNFLILLVHLYLLPGSIQGQSAAFLLAS